MLTWLILFLAFRLLLKYHLLEKASLTSVAKKTPVHFLVSYSAHASWHLSLPENTSPERYHLLHFFFYLLCLPTQLNCLRVGILSCLVHPMHLQERWHLINNRWKNKRKNEYGSTILLFILRILFLQPNMMQKKRKLSWCLFYKNPYFIYLLVVFPFCQ